MRIGPTRAIQPLAEADPIIEPRYTVAMNQPMVLGETPRSRTTTGAITGAQYTATATSVWMASVTASGVAQAERCALAPAGPESSPTLHRFQQPFGPLRDGIVDHLAIDLDCRCAAGLGCAECGDDTFGGCDLVSRRRIPRVRDADLVRMDTQPALVACAATAGDRATKPFHVLEVEPRAVQRALEACCARRKHDPRARVFELGLVVGRRKAEILAEVCSAERDAPHAPYARIRLERSCLQDPLDPGKTGCGLDDRDQV